MKDNWGKFERRLRTNMEQANESENTQNLDEVGLRDFELFDEEGLRNFGIGENPFESMEIPTLDFYF